MPSRLCVSNFWALPHQIHGTYVIKNQLACFKLLVCAFVYVFYMCVCCVCVLTCVCVCVCLYVCVCVFNRMQWS